MTIDQYFVRCGYVLLFGLLSVPVGRGQDGVCKSDDIPTNLVPVEEFHSPECGDDPNPYAKNAWRVEPVKEGIAVCALPNYQVIGPRVAELVQCETVESARCNPRLDGLPNATVLRSPIQCEKQKQLPDAEIKCNSSLTMRTLDSDGKSQYKIAQTISPNCTPSNSSPGQPAQTDTANAWVILNAKPIWPTWISVCADYENILRDELLVRRFNNVNCPPNKYVGGGTEGLTGWIITQKPPPGTIIVCTVYKKMDFTPLRLNPDNIIYHPPNFYSDRCGGPKDQPNSVQVNVSPTGDLTVFEPLKH
jgi:hypothetical protein